MPSKKNTKVRQIKEPLLGCAGVNKKAMEAARGKLKDERKTLNSLGLLAVMKDEILQYMARKCSEAKEE